MFKGYMGRMLFIDLSSAKIKEEMPDELLYRGFLGGYGIGARILFSRQKLGVDPLGPDNTLGFTTGLLTGTPVPLGCRYVVVAKSPLTRGWGDANSGGILVLISSSPAMMRSSLLEHLRSRFACTFEMAKPS